MRRPGHARRGRRAKLSSSHDGQAGTPFRAYSWADLVGYRGGLQEATQALPLLSPLLTRGQRWRAGWAEPRR
jgi:hypothetical protein